MSSTMTVPATTGGPQAIAVVNPATEETIREVAESSPAEVDAAVRRAAAALEAWAAVPLPERAAMVARVGEELASRRGELVDTIVAELGAPVTVTAAVQVDEPIRQFLAMPALARQLEAEVPLPGGIVVAEPVGVVAAITPWNYPLLQIAGKVAPALTAGCPVVLKPSEVTPLNALPLREACVAAGIPEGVFELVLGRGATVGEALVSHPLVDMVSFTGSTRAGRRISELAATTVKRTAMELGGKSGNVLLSDLDDDTLVRAVRDGVRSAFENSGQTCSALTRMIVPRSLEPRVREIAAVEAAAVRVGDPVSGETELGPLVSQAQFDRAQSYLESGVREGATVLVGGAGRMPGLDVGFFARPTVLAGVAPGDMVAQEEIFGPVLSIIAVADDDEAVRVVNDSPYGLAAGVWSADRARALAVARRIRAGIVRVNGAFEPQDAPFGGFKQSGHGREGGVWGIREFLTTKTLCVADDSER